MTLFRGLRLLSVMAASLSFCAATWAESRWKMQYMYDEDKSSLALLDISFAMST